MEEEKLISLAEKRKSDEAELNENESGPSSPKKICQVADSEAVTVSEINVISVSKFQSTAISVESNVLDSGKKIIDQNARAQPCTTSKELIISSDLGVVEESSKYGSIKGTNIANTNVAVSDFVSNVTTKNKSDEANIIPLSDMHINVAKDEDASTTNDIKEMKIEETNNITENISKNSDILSNDSESSKQVITTEDLNQPVADAKEADHEVINNDLIIPEKHDISDAILSSDSINKATDLPTCVGPLREINNSILLENMLESVNPISAPKEPQMENSIVDNKCASPLCATDTISDDVNAISNLKGSDNESVLDVINNPVSVIPTVGVIPFLQDTVLESTDTGCVLSDTTARNESTLNDTNNISILASTNDTIPIPDATIDLIPTLNDINATPILNDTIVAIPMHNNNNTSTVQNDDIIHEDLQSNLLLSENAQSPSFVSLKETSEHESFDVSTRKIPTLSESLKQAVSANSPCGDISSLQVPINGNEMLDAIKKNEPSPMEVDTPCESLIDTPCESGETTPSTSTPADSCQVSAAPSPLAKDDSAVMLPDNEDESSKDTKLNDEILDMKDDETDDLTPRRQSHKGASKGKKIPARSKQKGPLLLDEDTRMSANGNDKPSLIEFPPDDDSQSSVSTSLTSSKKKVRSFRSEVIVPESTEVFTADKVIEYIWPMDGNGEHYFIQEHVAQYLGITSFKRKYRDLRRRQIESTEKEYLKDMGLVSEMACDLGLTALRSEDMLDILFNDFPSKYEELQKLWRDRDEKQLKEKGKVDYQVANLDKSKMQEYSRKAALNASKWNAAFMREKREERRYSFDLQTFTVHYPLKTFKPTSIEPTIGSYPIAVLPGQYTDYCRSYISKELKSMPLQTVLTGPYTADELATEALSVESDDESAPASVCTSIDIKEEVPIIDLESTIPPVPVSSDPLSAEKQPRCKACNGGRDRNKEGKPEPLVICGTCRIASHLSCIDLPLTMIEKIEMYSWQCMECKTCAQCNDPDDEEKMIFCDMCDRGYHIYCVGLRRVPNGRWHCKECAICSSCGCKTPSGNEHIKNAEWQHEFKKDKAKQLKYICTLCVPCDKYWKRRQYCTVCLKVYRSIPDDGMVRCAGCPKYIHKDGCSLLVDNERHCTICYNSRNKTALNHSRIIAAAKKKMASSY